MGLLDGMTGLFEGVSAIDASECLVVRALYTKFHNKKAALVQGLQIVEESVGNAVGACADDDANNISYTESLFIEFAEMVDGGVSVGIGLKIGEIFHLRIFPGKELFAGFQLSRDAFLSLAIGRIEGAVVAVDAAAR